MNIVNRAPGTIAYVRLPVGPSAAGKDERFATEGVLPDENSSVLVRGRAGSPRHSTLRSPPVQRAGASVTFAALAASTMSVASNVSSSSVVAFNRSAIAR
jgi:hypothetical protein